MGRAQALAAKLEQLVLAAVEDEEIERDSLRQVIVGPGRLKDVIHVWASDSWEDYGEHDEESAFASISNAEWLDQLDAIEASASNTVSPPPPANREAAYQAQEERRRRGLGLLHPDPKVAAALDAKAAELKTDIEGALRLVATGARLGKFKNLVGLMSKGLSVSGYADLVAFYHPRGNEKLLPIHEHEEETDVYSVGALVSDGVLMFYPEGDEDSLSEGKGASKSRLFRFEDMRYWYGDDDDVTFRLKDSLFDTRLSHGHTHEEWGGPSGEDVDRALLAHFRTRPELEFDTGNPPLPEHTGAWQRFVSIFVECRIERSAVLDGFAKKGALDAVPRFLALLPADHPARAGLSMGYADKLLETGKHERALAVLDKLEVNGRLREWREELDCLYALGHHEELIARVAELEAADGDKVDETLPWKAMSLASLGFAADAIRFLDAKPKNPRDRDEHRCAWARAYALRKSDPAGAEKALWQAFASGSRWLEHAERDFGDAAPGVRALLERRRGLEMQRDVQADLLAGLERRVPEVKHPFDAAAVAESAADQWKLVSKAERPEKAKGTLKSLFLLGADAVAGTGEGGFARFSIADPSKPAFIGDFGANPGYSLDRAVQAGCYLYAGGWKAGVKVFDVTDRARPKLVGTAPQLLDDSPDDIAIGEGFLAVGTRAGAILYDLTDPANPDPVSIVAIGDKDAPSVGGVAARRFHVFVVSSRGLVVADARDRRAPRPVAFLSIDGVEPQDIELFDDIAVLSTGNGVWLVDVKDPANPKSLGTFPSELRFRAAVRAGTRLFALTDNREVITLDLSAREKPVVSGFSRLLAPDGKDQVMSYPYGALHLDGRLVVAEENSLMVFVREPRPVSTLADPAPKITAAEPRLVTWIEERLKEQRGKDAEFRAGALMLERWDGTLRLTLDAPRSYAGLESGPVVEDPPQFEVELPELLRRKGETEQIVESDAPEGVSRDDQRRYADLSARAWEASLDRVLRAVPGTTAFKDIASGRVHVLSGGVLTRLIATAADPAKPWKPYRRSVPERKVRTLEDRLKDWDELEKNIARAKAEPEVKSAVLRLAGEGDGAGTRIALELPAEDAPAVLEAYSRALRAGRGDSNALEWVVEHLDLPGAKALLEALLAGEAGKTRGADDERRPWERIAAAKALGRCEDDDIVAIVKTLLDDPDNDYSDAELAASALDGIERRLSELLSNLRGWVERAGDDNRLPLIAKHLFRAGEPEPPAMLVEQASREKRDEQYHSTKTGIKILDEAEWYENDACKSERLWTGRRFALRAAELKAKGDSVSPLWPADWEPEPHQASWNYLLRSAWLHLEKAGAVDWLVQRLAAAQSGKEHASDRAIVLCVLNHYAIENDMDRLIPLAESVLRSAPGTFAEGEDEDGDELDDATTKKRVRNKLTMARVVKGFQLGREGKLVEARRHAEAALKEDPTDGQVLFLDARLTWLEDESPQAGVERAMANLGKIDAHDDAGTGRLLNLIGCAYDELKRYDDAVIWFEKAAQAHRDPMYLANLAEIHEKRGDIPAAVKYAEQAKRKGAKSDLVTRLLAEHGGSEDDEEGNEDEDDLAAEIAGDEEWDDDESTVADEDEEEDE